MSTLEEIKPRMNAATLALYQHEERMAQAARSAEPTVTVEFTRNAKGETQIATKVHAPGSVDAGDLARLAALVYQTAVETYETATARYPAGSGFVTNDGKEAK